jgi:hypothetical protein
MTAINRKWSSIVRAQGVRPRSFQTSLLALHGGAVARRPAPIEREINGATAEQRLAVRKERVKPLIGELEKWMRAERARLSRHADLAKAIDYMLKRWPAFTRFLELRIARSGSSNSMLGSPPTTPQDYPERSGFAARREREWGHRRHCADANRRPRPCASTSLAMTGSPSAASRRP